MQCPTIAWNSPDGTELVYASRAECGRFGCVGGPDAIHRLGVDGHSLGSLTEFSSYWGLETGVRQGGVSLSSLRSPPNDRISTIFRSVSHLC